MEKSFDSKDYIKHLATELVRDFEYSSCATTPVLVGSAREKAVIKKLEMLLPNYVSVGSGCIIDSFGNTSKQLDIVLYEKEFCPKFCINESAETTYYPCEGVIAVGEVKSILNSKELENIFDKSLSVKQLRRYSVAEKSTLNKSDDYCFRKYGNQSSIIGAPEENYDQTNKSTDQIFFFALCGKLDITIELLEKKYYALLQNCAYVNEPNLISILDYGLLFYLNSQKRMICNSAKDSDSFFITGKRDNNFEFLLSKLHEIVISGRTVPVNAFQRYITLDSTISTSGGRQKKYK
jgi:hypothetical protein